MTERPSQLSCIGCGRQLDPALPDDVDFPGGGTRFTSGGHYGSTAFDPMGPARLAVIVCDPCLVKHAARVRHTTDGTDRHATWTTWEPSDTTDSWVTHQAATHNAQLGYPRTLTDGTHIEVTDHDGTTLTLNVDGTEHTLTVGDTFPSRTNTCHVTKVYAVPAEGPRADDPWYPAGVFTEGAQLSFADWCAKHREDDAPAD